MKPFLQISDQQPTIEYWKQILNGRDLSSLGLFAYVTDSGVSQLISHLTDSLNSTQRCRWVFGVDYGRTQPTALRKLSETWKSEIRIYDGDYVVRSKDFIPRKSFHLKTALTHHSDGSPFKQIIGSGNLSATGLLVGIEAGVVIDHSNLDGVQGKALTLLLEEIWDNSSPLENIINEYELKYKEVHLPVIKPINENDGIVTQIFWIDVGYVTKNRGSHKPGNQFDLPKGSHIHFGLDQVTNPQINSFLGDLIIQTPSGDTVIRPLRYGNNAMEKLTLPLPEEHGYGCYDGKILIFKRDSCNIILEALEYDDFQRIYGMHISSFNKMQSGRTYGTISTKGKLH